MDTPKCLTTYYFILASSDFLLVTEPVEEILRERVQHFRRIKKSTNFWLIRSPKFMESIQLVDLRGKVSQDCSAVVSLDKSFITWLKLRLNNVAMGSFVAPTDDIISPLASSLMA